MLNTPENNQNVLDTLNDLSNTLTDLLSNEHVTTSLIYSKEQEELLIRVTIKNTNLPFKSFTIEDIKNI